MFSCCAAVAQQMPSPSDWDTVVQRQGRGIFPASVQEGHLLATVLKELPLPRWVFLWLCAAQAACGHEGGADRCI